MYLVVGAGLSGAVLAERLASQSGQKVLVIDARDHIGGNCYDYIDSETGIRLNKYGAHLFHTNDQGVWNYINQFDEWVRWEHRVLSMVENQFVPIPVNITTVNMLVPEANLQNSEEMDQWLQENQIHYSEIKNSQEMAESRVGRDLYQKMFKPYTVKQWDRDPSELDKSVLARIPVRNNFDVRYFADKYQALPKDGYTHFFERLLDHPQIEVRLGVDFFDLMKESDWNKNSDGSRKFKGIIYTGPVDQYFKQMGSDLESLEYRSIDFKLTKLKGVNFFQPNSVVNYPELEYPFTRIVEYKHFLNQSSQDTLIVSETTNDHGDPYYPVPNARNLELYSKYQKMAAALEPEIYFVGRLATYKYYNMDQAIRAALDLFEKISV